MAGNIISDNSTILDAFRQLNDLSGKEMTLFVADKQERIIGTITDGDIRRSIISGRNLNDPIDMAMNRDFSALHYGQDEVENIIQFRKKGIKIVPVIDETGKLHSVLNLEKNHSLLPLNAILMAGGKGERLRPLTLNTPKPLLKIGDKSIIDYNIDALHRCGVENITITVNYLANQIIDHFADTSVKCVKEEMPLGTIGSAALADIPDEGLTIVMNSDLLTTISYEDMYLHHKATGADITIAAIPYQVSVPFAILSINEGNEDLITGLEEKPIYSYFANAGIYIFPNRMLKNLPLDQRTDATDLIQKALDDQLKVSYFPINGTWIDIGSPSDFKQATELMKSLAGFNK